MTVSVILTGSLVRLEPLAINHARPLLAAATEPGARYDFTFVPTDAGATASYIQTALCERADRTSLAFAIIDLSCERVVGSSRFLDLAYWAEPLGISFASPALRRSPSVAEVGGTWLAVSAQRTGINTEAKLLMLSHAFEDWGVHRVTLKSDARNAQSRTAIERIGATYEGTRRAHTPTLDGTIRDTAYYSILAAEWPTIRQRLCELLSRGGHPIDPTDVTMGKPRGQPRSS